VNIIIVGVGDVGRHLAETLISQHHSLGIIESSEDVIEGLQEQLDAQIIRGNGSTVSALAEANVAEADLFMALSGDDNSNLVACSLAKALGAKRTIGRVHALVQRDEWLFSLKDHFQIDHLFSTQRLAAIEMAKYVRNPEGLLVEEIAHGSIEVQQVKICADSRALGVPLNELSLPKRVRIGSVQRDDSLFVPVAADTLAEGDLITLFGSPHALSEVLPLFRTDAVSESEVNVVIFGGGEYGFSLAQMLEGKRYRCRIIERDEKICHDLSGVLQNTVVINGDGTSAQQLKEEQVGDADFFIATSTDDEDNVMTCLQAKNLGTKYCLTLIHRADYAEVVSRNSKQLQIHAAVSPREATNRDLLRYISQERSNTVLQLDGDAEVIEAAVPESGQLTDRKISEVAWPEGSGLVALVRGSEALVPGADDVLEAGDTLYGLVSAKAKRRFLRLLKS